MRERPILFSAPMVRAILEGRKTQTRRVVKGDIEDVAPPEWYAARRLLHRLTCQRAYCENVDDIGGLACGGFELHPNGQVLHQSPWGVPGDRLWVREGLDCGPFFVDAGGPGAQYAADGMALKGVRWRWRRSHLPGMFLPRPLSRITLEVTGVRVERLQDISEEDAKAEGYEDSWAHTPRANFLRGEWAASKLAANPWVWVVEFKRVAQEARAA